MPYALFLHFEMHQTFAKMLQASQMACCTFTKKESVNNNGTYVRKALLHHRFLKGVVIKVPRLSPPRSRVEPEVKRIRELIGVESAEDGRLAFRSWTTVVQELLSHL